MLQGLLFFGIHVSALAEERAFVVHPCHRSQKVVEVDIAFPWAFRVWNVGRLDVQAPKLATPCERTCSSSQVILSMMPRRTKICVSFLAGNCQSGTSGMVNHFNRVFGSHRIMVWYTASRYSTYLLDIITVCCTSKPSSNH